MRKSVQRCSSLSLTGTKLWEHINIHVSVIYCWLTINNLVKDNKFIIYSSVGQEFRKGLVEMAHFFSTWCWLKDLPGSGGTKVASLTSLALPLG